LAAGCRGAATASDVFIVYIVVRSILRCILILVVKQVLETGGHVSTEIVRTTDSTPNADTSRIDPAKEDDVTTSDSPYRTYSQLLLMDPLTMS